MFTVFESSSDETKSFKLSNLEARGFPVVANFDLTVDRIIHRQVNEYLIHVFKTAQSKASINQNPSAAARALCYWLNFVHYHDINRSTNRSEFDITSNDIQNYRNYLKAKAHHLSANTRNNYIYWIYAFYWYCDYIAKYGYGMIGIQQPEKGILYPIYVERGTGRKPFRIPNTESVLSKQRATISTKSMWISAIREAANSGRVIGYRDSLIMELILKFGLRREEVTTLEISSFVDEAPASAEIRDVSIQLSKTKNEERHGRVGRVALGDKDLYNRIRQFIKYRRKKYRRKGVIDDAVFLSMKTGKRINPSSLSAHLQKTYGMNPHEGRKVSATEQFKVLILKGVDEKQALLIVGQNLGHSVKSEGSTLKQSYLQAQQLLAGDERKTKQEQLEEAEKSKTSLQNELQQRDEQLQTVKNELESLRARVKTEPS